MECQSSTANKRKLEDSDTITVQSKSKVRCAPIVEAVPSGELISQSLPEIEYRTQESYLLIPV